MKMYKLKFVMISNYIIEVARASEEAIDTITKGLLDPYIKVLQMDKDSKTHTYIMKDNILCVQFLEEVVEDKK